ncbi:hypothetical protein GRAN_2634 [Granulicella sibirica]|uniref:Uncharacterized protein n=2 Tax=Granulicella sibirica TaxID=2479048 RepID=A0A4Q0SY36_9BACT|nr:hypothetical protein GRAN_2634 [Granulicella sibirica]
MNFEDSNTISVGRDPDVWRSHGVAPIPKTGKKDKAATVKSRGKGKPAKSIPLAKARKFNV